MCNYFLPFHLFLQQNNHVEAPEEHPKKTKLFFIHAAENWNAEFYAKVNDNVYVNLGMWSLMICKIMNNIVHLRVALSLTCMLFHLKKQEACRLHENL